MCCCSHVGVQGCAHTNRHIAAAASTTTTTTTINVTVSPFGSFVCLFLFFLLVSFIYRQCVNGIFICYLKIRFSNLFY